jgi:hypothetical protein
VTIPLPILISSDQSRFDKLDEWIRTILWDDTVPGLPTPVKVLRSKGLILRQEEDGRLAEWVLQGVRGLYDIFEVGMKEGINGSEAGKIVLIGNLAGVESRSIVDSLHKWIQ